MEWVEQTRLSWLEAALAALKSAVRRSGASAGRPAHLTTGIEGEDAAFFYLRRKGYVVVARRWATSSQRGDLDLIAWQGPVLCFIEVKTRTAHDMAAAESAVDWQKRSVLRKLARRYVRQLPAKTSPPVRFDVLSVYLVPGREKEFVHFEGAFGWSEPSRWERWDERA
jgi:putative endonuclease